MIRRAIKFLNVRCVTIWSFAGSDQSGDAWHDPREIRHARHVLRTSFCMSERFHIAYGPIPISRQATIKEHKRTAANHMKQSVHFIGTRNTKAA